MAFNPRNPGKGEIERAIRDIKQVPGGVPLLGQAPPKPKESQYICPVCRKVPNELPFPNQFGTPPGTPECYMTQILGEPAPTFSCTDCQIRFMRKYVPQLVKRDEVPVAELDDDDAAED